MRRQIRIIREPILIKLGRQIHYLRIFRLPPLRLHRVFICRPSVSIVHTLTYLPHRRNAMKNVLHEVNDAKEYILYLPSEDTNVYLQSTPTPTFVVSVFQFVQRSQYLPTYLPSTTYTRVSSRKKIQKNKCSNRFRLPTLAAWNKTKFTWLRWCVARVVYLAR